MQTRSCQEVGRAKLEAFFPGTVPQTIANDRPGGKAATTVATAQGCSHPIEMLPLHREAAKAQEMLLSQGDAPTTQRCFHHSEMLLPHRDAANTQRCFHHTEMLLPLRDAPTAQRCSYHSEMILPHRNAPTTQILLPLRDAPTAQRCSYRSEMLLPHRCFYHSEMLPRQEIDGP